MRSNQSLQTKTLIAASKKNDSTHGIGPEASAATLILLLRDAYPHIKTRILTERIPVNNAQATSTPQNLCNEIEFVQKVQGSLAIHVSNIIHRLLTAVYKAQAEKEEKG